MTMATLIAADRLDDRLRDAALARLAAARLGARAGAWVEPGSAIGLIVDGPAGGLRDALAGWEAVDLVVAPEVAPGLFVADMDSTMIGQECIDELADYAGLKAEVAAVTERAMQGELDFEAALRARVALLAGLDEGAITRCLADRVRPNPGAATLVRTLRARGVTTLLVSGGFTAFAEPVARQIGFEQVEANRLAAAGGQLTGAVDGRIVDADHKRRALERERDRLGLPSAATIAIGDGANDRMMVEAAGLGVAYRAKPALVAVADARLDHHPLDALLWALGVPSSEWVFS